MGIDIGAARNLATYQHQPVQPYRPYESVETFDPAMYGQLLNAMLALNVADGGGGAPTGTTSYNQELARRQAAATAKESAGSTTNDQLIRQLLLQYNRSQNTANLANTARYNAILHGYDRRIAGANQLLTGLGTQSKQDILRRGIEAKATRNQDLVARGLAGTSRKPVEERKVDEETERALARLDEQLRREQLAYQTQLTGDRLSFMERRTDEQPDLNQMVALLAQLGAT